MIECALATDDVVVRRPSSELRTVYNDGIFDGACRWTACATPRECVDLAWTLQHDYSLRITPLRSAVLTKSRRPVKLVALFPENALVQLIARAELVNREKGSRRSARTSRVVPAPVPVPVPVVSVPVSPPVQAHSASLHRLGRWLTPLQELVDAGSVAKQPPDTRIPLLRRM